MRAAVGLVGLLIGIGLLVWLYSAFALPTAKEGRKVQDQASQISGRDTEGVAAKDSFAAEGTFKGSTLESLKVTSVMADGPMASHFGLKEGDSITAVNGMKVHDLSNGDDELAEALVSEAYGKQQTITVRRAGRTLNLPADRNKSTPGDEGWATPPQEVPTANQPAEPAPPPKPRQPGGLEGQLDAIRNAGGATGQDQ